MIILRLAPQQKRQDTKVFSVIAPLSFPTSLYGTPREIIYGGKQLVAASDAAQYGGNQPELMTRGTIRLKATGRWTRGTLWREKLEGMTRGTIRLEATGRWTLWYIMAGNNWKA